MAKKPQDILARLEALGNEKVRALDIRNGAGENQFGVKLGDIRALAREFKVEHELALALWQTKNLDARLLAILLMKPGDLTPDDVDQMVRSADVAQVADWFNAYVVKNHPSKEVLRAKWMADDNPWAARAGWSLTSERIARKPEGLDLSAVLDRIEAGMEEASPAEQWTMNGCLAGIGIHNSGLRERAIAIGEKLGVYRDYPVSKGCTSPFAPVWIAEMVRRKG